MEIRITLHLRAKRVKNKDNKQSVVMCFSFLVTSHPPVFGHVSINVR